MQLPACLWGVSAPTSANHRVANIDISECRLVGETRDSGLASSATKPYRFDRRSGVSPHEHRDTHHCRVVRSLTTPFRVGQEATSASDDLDSPVLVSHLSGRFPRAITPANCLLPASDIYHLFDVALPSFLYFFIGHLGLGYPIVPVGLPVLVCFSFFFLTPLLLDFIPVFF
jgi:hypothetical protein